MAYKRITLTLVLHLAVLVALSSLAGGIWVQHQYILSVFLWLVATGEVAYLIHLYNKINRTVAYFFESIENGDSQLRFPLKNGNRSQRRLHESLNRVNSLISQTKMKNEQNEKYLEELIQHSATGLLALNAGNKPELINRTALELIGLGQHGHFAQLQHKNEELWNLLCGIRPGQTQTCRLTQEGTFRHLSVRATEIRFQNSVTKLISIQDIRQELDSRELESWQKLISILTHEIMNSVAPITSLTTTLRKFFSSNDVPTPETIRQTLQGLEIIEERGTGLIRFVDKYRKLTKTPPPVFSTFSAYDWLNKIRILMHEKLNENQVQLDINVDKQADLMTADENLMSQVLLNIVNNAVDALQQRSDHRKITISIVPTASGQRQITIENNGEPIPAYLLEQVFVPFYSTKEKGSGIGLSLSRQIVQMHGGYMNVVSGGQSTKFMFEI